MIYVRLFHLAARILFTDCNNSPVRGNLLVCSLNTYNIWDSPASITGLLMQMLSWDPINFWLNVTKFGVYLACQKFFPLVLLEVHTKPSVPDWLRNFKESRLWSPIADDWLGRPPQSTCKMMCGFLHLLGPCHAVGFQNRQSCLNSRRLLTGAENLVVRTFRHIFTGQHPSSVVFYTNSLLISLPVSRILLPYIYG